MRAVLFTENTSPSYLTHLLYVGVATGAAVAGYHGGRNYVMDHYYMGDPQAFLMGGYSGAVACFGLALQILVDLSRLKPMKWLDEKLKQLEQLLLYFLQREAPRLNEQLLENRAIARVHWNNTRGHVVKWLGLRLMHYSVAGAVGVAATGYPMKVMYGGGDMTEPAEQHYALLATVILAGFEMGLSFAAYRSDQRSGVALVGNAMGLFHATARSDETLASDVGNQLSNRSTGGSPYSAV
ncbi:MAG: hypothetical protein A3F10_03225 [Coxiella sp. RIFCSPHIGHO2_12_FULL_42_15]|nr:MAG: hypothetical protein A3F10_03225 [Coxiella sp. RIFCSPHIGHO2_12_FULL_42_15]